MVKMCGAYNACKKKKKRKRGKERVSGISQSASSSLSQGWLSVRLQKPSWLPNN